MMQRTRALNERLKRRVIHYTTTVVHAKAYIRQARHIWMIANDIATLSIQTERQALSSVRRMSGMMMCRFAVCSIQEVRCGKTFDRNYEGGT